MERKKLHGNGLWESSRFIVPELSQRINEDQQKKLLRSSRPELDEQEQEYIVRCLYESLKEDEEITIRIWSPREDLRYKGTVIKVLQDSKQIKFSLENGEIEYFFFSDIVGVE